MLIGFGSAAPSKRHAAAAWVIIEQSLVAMAVRRRVNGKQPDMAVRVAEQALCDEGWSELTALSNNARRKHMHWTHVRTRDATQKQPHEFTRAEFYEHLCRVYRDVYPELANASGSIVLFGMVAKEMGHAGSSDEALHHEHNHAPVYTSMQHYWRPVAKRSLEHYGVKLHAACHEG